MSTFACISCNWQFETPEGGQERELFCPRCGDAVTVTSVTAEKPAKSSPGLDLFSSPAEPFGTSDQITEHPFLVRKLQQQFPDLVLPKFGSVVAQFRPSQEKRWIAGLFGAAVLILGMVFFVAAMLILFNPAEGTFGKRFVMVFRALIVTSILFPMGGVLLYNAFLRLDMTAVVFQDGVMLIEGKSISSMRWDDMEVVQEGIGGFFLEGIPLVKTRRLVVVDRTGRGLAFTNALAKFPKLAEIIHEQVVGRQLPPAREKLASGQPVPFGVVTIDGKGLTIDGKATPWGEIESLRIERDCLFVRKQRSFWTVKSGDTPIALQTVPNVFVLMALATEMLSRNS
jgi:hypothetical protein